MATMANGRVSPDPNIDYPNSNLGNVTIVFEILGTRAFISNYQ